MTKLVTTVLLLLSGAVALAQTPRDTGIVPKGTVSVNSSGKPIEVYESGKLLGMTPVMATLDTGVRVLKFASSQNQGWHQAFRSETLLVKEGERLERTITPIELRRITSEPFGASIYAGDSLLGITPSMLALDASVRSIRISKNGYEQKAVVVPDSGDISVDLVPAATGPDVERPGFLANGVRRNDFKVYASGGLAVAGGILAAYAKIKADNYYTQYRATGDASLLDKIHSLDRVSGISLAVSEAGVAVLTYLLLTR